MRFTSNTLSKESTLNPEGALRNGQFSSVMFTDIVGYTLLVDKNQDLALQVLAHNRRMQKSLIKFYGGRWVKEMGDGILATFSSNSAAVSCAQHIQRAAIEINHLKLRIGIHSGQVFLIDDDVFGIVVNIASRLQVLANPGQIVVSEEVARNIVTSELKPRSIGLKKLKNLKNRVRTFVIEYGQRQPGTVNNKILNSIRIKIQNVFGSVPIPTNP